MWYYFRTPLTISSTTVSNYQAPPSHMFLVTYPKFKVVYAVAMFMPVLVKNFMDN